MPAFDGRLDSLVVVLVEEDKEKNEGKHKTKRKMIMIKIRIVKMNGNNHATFVSRILERLVVFLVATPNAPFYSIRYYNAASRLLARKDRAITSLFKRKKNAPGE